MRLKIFGQSLLLLSTASFFASSVVFSQIEISFVDSSLDKKMTFNGLAREVSSRTSIELIPTPVFFSKVTKASLDHPWIWTRTPEILSDKSGRMSPEIVRWVKRGGMIIIEGGAKNQQSQAIMLDGFTSSLAAGAFRSLGWKAVPQDHELMRSFYLLPTLPGCNNDLWQWFGVDGRVAIVQVPYNFSDFLQDKSAKPGCDSLSQNETQTRVFVNLLLVALTTDYKKDQIHLPEILKRLRSP